MSQSPDYGRPPAFGGQLPPAPPPAQMGGCLKAILWMLGVGAFCSVICCGVGSWLGSAILPTQVKEDVTKIQQGIVAVDVPKGFEPQGAINVWWLGVRGAIYHRKSDNSVMWVVAIPKWLLEKPSVRKQIDDARDEAVAKGGAEDFEVTETRTKTVKINGTDVDFKVETGTGKKTQKEFRSAMGEFNLDDSLVILGLRGPADEVDDELIDKTLESIKPAAK